MFYHPQVSTFRFRKLQSSKRGAFHLAPGSKRRLWFAIFANFPPTPLEEQLPMSVFAYTHELGGEMRIRRMKWFICRSLWAVKWARAESKKEINNVRYIKFLFNDVWHLMRVDPVIRWLFAGHLIALYNIISSDWCWAVRWVGMW